MWEFISKYLQEAGPSEAVRLIFEICALGTIMVLYKDLRSERKDKDAANEKRVTQATSSMEKQLETSRETSRMIDGFSVTLDTLVRMIGGRNE